MATTRATRPRIFEVADGDDIQLFRAIKDAQVRKHVASQLSVSLPSDERLHELGKQGVPITDLLAEAG